MLYLVYNTNYYKYYRKEKEKHSYYLRKVNLNQINLNKYKEVNKQYQIKAVV